MCITLWLLKQINQTIKNSTSCMNRNSLSQARSTLHSEPFHAVHGPGLSTEMRLREHSCAELQALLQHSADENTAGWLSIYI